MVAARARVAGGRRPYVVFDLDDTLANLREHLMAMLNRRTGRSIHWTDWRRYELVSVYGASVEQILEWVLADRVLEAATLEPDAPEVVAAARRAGYRVAVVTARGWHPRGKAITRGWLRRHGLEVDALHLVEAFGSKAEVLARLGGVRHYIDDHAGHLHPARALPGVQDVHLLDRPWNREDATLNRVHALADFVRILGAEGDR
jgi:FMN phosphatase YigB (HAD superfamily)